MQRNAMAWLWKRIADHSPTFQVNGKLAPSKLPEIRCGQLFQHEPLLPDILVSLSLPDTDR